MTVIDTPSGPMFRESAFLAEVFDLPAQARRLFESTALLVQNRKVFATSEQMRPRAVGVSTQDPARLLIQRFGVGKPSHLVIQDRQVVYGDGRFRMVLAPQIVLQVASFPAHSLGAVVVPGAPIDLDELL